MLVLPPARGADVANREFKHTHRPSMAVFEWVVLTHGDGVRS